MAFKRSAVRSRLAPPKSNAADVFEAVRRSFLKDSAGSIYAHNTSTSDTSSYRRASGENSRHAGVCIWHEEVLTVEEFLKDFELEAWGEGELAYIKQLKAKDVAELFPQLGGLPGWHRSLCRRFCRWNAHGADR